MDSLESPILKINLLTVIMEEPWLESCSVCGDGQWVSDLMLNLGHLCQALENKCILHLHG